MSERGGANRDLGLGHWYITRSRGSFQPVPTSLPAAPESASAPAGLTSLTQCESWKHDSSSGSSQSSETP
jgi:hypothetical protein